MRGFSWPLVAVLGLGVYAVLQYTGVTGRR